MTEYTHGLRCQILRGQYHGPGKGGVSATVNEVTLVGPGIHGRDRVTETAPAVALFETAPGYLVAKPVADPPRERTGYMASGAYIIGENRSTEWKAAVGTHGAIPLHDRTELWAHHGIRV